MKTNNGDTIYDAFGIVAVGWGAPADRDGNPVRRTKQTNPYNYDTFVLWKSEDFATAYAAAKGKRSGVDSDRLYQWDAKKHDDLCKKHFGNVGQYWDNRDPATIEAWLRDYYPDYKNLKLIMIEEWCNQSSGYPGWSFTFTY